ncbi:HNH endonuclease signature motif containing protein [Bacillus taeanensis]|uniref:HNH endonuclease n=1 Tax=Bacillus taeanensis TaxID=273032 RepID=A0A366XU91_9BACI|nr:HNH endonuclease signature motif containing protein [Bacillus taeanensis]RBW69467.1 HNH endonuclease [Bacillus taeanensis]
MPRKALKKCNVMSCPELTSDTYCEQHREEKDLERKENHREYKRERKDKKEQAFYNSSEWIRLRDWKRSKSPLCEHCLKQGKLTPVDVVDHIEEIKDNPSRSLDPSNLMSLCHRHHNKKTARVKKEREQNKK